MSNYDHFIGTQKKESVRGRFEIVEQLNVSNVESLRQRVPIDNPGKVGCVAAIIDDWAGHSEAARRYDDRIRRQLRERWNLCSTLIFIVDFVAQLVLGRSLWW